MAHTERIVLLIAPEDKADLEKKARDIGVSTAEYIRRASLAYDPQEDVEKIRKMLQKFNEVHQTTLETLDRAERDIAETMKYFTSKRAASSEASRGETAA